MRLIGWMLMAWLASSPAQAATFLSGTTISVPAGQVIDDDVYATGDTIQVDGTIKGDLFAAGREVFITGSVDGSAMTAGAIVKSTGTIGRSIRAAGGRIDLDGTVRGDAMLTAGEVVLQSGSRVGKDLFIGAENAKIQGDIGRNISAGARTFELNSAVGGDLDVEVSDLSFGPKARVKGEARYVSAKDAEVHASAQVAGLKRTEAEPSIDVQSLLIGEVVRLLMALATGAVLTLLFPRRFIHTADSLRDRPLPSFGIGLLLFVTVPVATLMLLATIIGIPIALMLGAFYAMAMYVSTIVVALALGAFFVRVLRQPAERISWTLVSIAIGLVILKLIFWIPYLGALVSFLTLIGGLGALVVGERQIRITPLRKEVAAF